MGFWNIDTRRGMQARLEQGAGLFATLGLLAPGSALAQAGTATAPTRDQLDLPAFQEPEYRPELKVEGEVERAPCSLADPAYSTVKIDFKGAEFNNLAPVTKAEVEEIYAPLVGKQHPISVLCDIRDAVGTMLRQRGFVAAVQIPVQRIEQGVVQFEVLYAKLVSVRVMGEAGGHERALEKFLEGLVDGQPFNSRRAERSLLLAQDLPGSTVRLALRPTGEKPGEMVGEVRIDHVPIMADISVQNLASKQTGRFGGQARVQFNGLTGLGDRTTLSAYSTADFEEQQVYQLGHEMLVGRNGLRVGLKGSYALTRPDLGTGVPPVRGKTLIGSVEASYPLQRSQAFSLTAAIGMDLLNQRIRFAGLPLSKDRLRAAYGRLSWEAVDLKGVGPGNSIGWRSRGSVELRRGLSAFNASIDCATNVARCAAPGFVPLSIPGADPQATLARMSVETEFRPLEKLAVAFTARAQLASNPLPAFEQFSLGNYTIGRGFDPGAVTGDNGFAFQTELRPDGIRLSRTKSLILQPYAFVDNGWAWRKGVGGDPLKLSSVGAGARFLLPGKARLDLAGSIPTRKLPGETKRRDIRLLATLTMNVFPWSAR